MAIKIQGMPATVRSRIFCLH